MEESIKTISQYIVLLAPIFILLLMIWFYQTMRFVSWFIAEREKDEEAKYLRLKQKYESERGDE